MNYDEYNFNIKGIIKVNSPKGVMSITIPKLKEALYTIEAFNKLLELGENTKSTVKGNQLLEQLTQKISGRIEIISHEAIK